MCGLNYYVRVVQVLSMLQSDTTPHPPLTDCTIIMKGLMSNWKDCLETLEEALKMVLILERKLDH